VLVLVEYACLTTALALLTIGVAGPHGQRVAKLPVSGAAAIRLVLSGARAQHIPATEARAAYQRAPYKKPVLKYLFAAGWIGGKKRPASCLVALGSSQDARQQAAGELRHNTTVAGQLRRLHVPVRVGAAALVRGIVSACS
jgi:hypothetical protein